MKLYAVIGIEHGSIVEAYTRRHAVEIFQRTYKDEKVLYVKDITNHNLINL